MEIFYNKFKEVFGGDIKMENHELFENLYQRYFSKAYKAAYLVARDEDIAQDCVQETFLAVYDILKKKPVDISRLPAFSALSLPKKLST